MNEWPSGASLGRYKISIGGGELVFGGMTICYSYQKKEFSSSQGRI